MWLGGINLKEFLSTYQEWHALVLGLFGVLCPFPSKHKPSDELVEQIQDEYHYYQFGRAIGIILWIVIAVIIKVVF